MPRILLIDDDDSLRNTLSVILEQLGHVVIAARNGAEGLKLFARARADLVLTDIVMPEKEGLEVLMALRTEQPPVKIIAMSGSGRLWATDNLHLAKLLGAASVLEKPFSREALATAINETLACRRPLARPTPASLTLPA